MTASAGPALKRLHDELGEQIRFVSLYVREAHPGDYFPQPQSFDEKVHHARAYKVRDAIRWPVAVDDLAGTLHQALDPRPSAVYLMDVHGRVAFRTLWSNDYRTIRKGIDAALSGAAPSRKLEATHVIPMLRGIGQMDEIWREAGPTARRDARWQIPPIYAVARVASALRPLPPLGRGIGAVAIAGAGAVLLTKAVASLVRLSRARRRWPPKGPRRALASKKRRFGYTTS